MLIDIVLYIDCCFVILMSVHSLTQFIFSVNESQHGHHSADQLCGLQDLRDSEEVSTIVVFKSILVNLLPFSEYMPTRLESTASPLSYQQPRRQTETAEASLRWITSCSMTPLRMRTR